MYEGSILAFVCVLSEQVSRAPRESESTVLARVMVLCFLVVALSSISLPENTTSKCGFMLRRTPYTSIQLLSIILNILSTYSGTDMATRRRDLIRGLCSKAWARPFLSINPGIGDQPCRQVAAVMKTPWQNPGGWVAASGVGSILYKKLISTWEYAFSRPSVI